MKIGLVSCTKRKRSYPCPAWQLYSESALFRYAFEYCKKHYDKVYILSAKHGLLEPDRKIKPYDTALKKMSREGRRAWSRKVANQLKEVIKEDDVLYFHAGKEYWEFLIPLLGNQIEIPLKHIGIGKQLKFYKRNP